MPRSGFHDCRLLLLLQQQQLLLLLEKEGGGGEEGGCGGGTDDIAAPAVTGVIRYHTVVQEKGCMGAGCVNPTVQEKEGASSSSRLRAS